MALVTRGDGSSVGRTQERQIAKAIGATEDNDTGASKRGHGDTEYYSPNPPNGRPHR